LDARETKKNISGPGCGGGRTGVNGENAEDCFFAGQPEEKQSRGVPGLYDALTGWKTVIANEEFCTAGSDHAVVTWVTPGQKTDTSIYVGNTPANMVRYTFGQESEYHYAEIPGLKPSTRYWYQLSSCLQESSSKNRQSLKTAYS
jgi:hypothetical protein